MKITEIVAPEAKLTAAEERWLAAFRRMDRNIVCGQLAAVEAVARACPQRVEPRLHLVRRSAP